MILKCLNIVQSILCTLQLQPPIRSTSRFHYCVTSRSCSTTVDLTPPRGIPIYGLVGCTAEGEWVVLVILKFVGISGVLVTCLKDPAGLQEVLT